MSIFTTGGPEVMFIVVTFLAAVKPTAHIRIWDTLYMDDESTCEVFIRNDDLEEGDMYLIRSDNWQGGSPWARRPAECTININLGDRLVALNLVEWSCDKVFKDPFLAIYDTCLGDRTNLLARYNCSSLTPRTVHSSGTCISLYHFRGHTRWGYYFRLQLVAQWEVIAFPAGGIAALIVMCIVVIMVIVKIVCVLTGYENRLPVIRIDPEDPKQTLLALDIGGTQEGALQETTLSPGVAEGSGAEGCSSRRTPTRSSSSSRAHPLLTKSHSSNPSTRHHSELHECWDSDGLESYSPPRLKRYCSVRASGILKL